MTIRLTILILLFSFNSWGQKTVYCQGCCACINVHYLTLKEDNHFEIFYSDPNNKDDFGQEFYGKGKYIISNKVLILNFEDLSPQGITMEKISDSDSLIVDFSIFSNFDNEELIATNVAIPTNQKYSFVYGDIKRLKMPFSKQENIQLSFVGHGIISHSFTSSGHYKIRAVLGSEAKYKFKKGERMKFKLIKTIDGTNLKSIEGTKIKFTTRTCDC